MPPDSVWTVETRVNLQDCDVNLRWKPAALFLVLLKAAADHAASFGLDYQRMFEQGNAFVLSRFRIHYRAHPRMDQAVTIRTWPRGLQQRLFFTRDFTLHDERAETIAVATSAWLLIDPRTRRLLLPNKVVERLPDNTGRVALDLDLLKIDPPEDLPERGVFQANYSAVDILGHVNSMRYLEWLSDALGLPLLSAHQVDWLQINFLHETRPADQVSLRAAPDPADPLHWRAEGYNLTSAKRGFEAELGLSPLQG